MSIPDCNFSYKFATDSPLIMTAIRESLVVFILFSVVLGPPKPPGPSLAPEIIPSRYASQFLEKLLATGVGGVRWSQIDLSSALDQGTVMRASPSYAAFARSEEEEECFKRMRDKDSG